MTQGVYPPMSHRINVPKFLRSTCLGVEAEISSSTGSMPERKHNLVSFSALHICEENEKKGIKRLPVIELVAKLLGALLDHRGLVCVQAQTKSE